MKVTLLKPHTHAGQSSAAGEIIDVDAATAQWLADNGVIEVTVSPVAAPATQSVKE